MAIGNLPQKGGNLEDVRNDIQNIVKLHGTNCLLIRETSEYGNSGEIINTQKKYYKIWTKFTDISRKNRQFSEAGQLKQGEIEAIFFHKYLAKDTRSEDVVVKVGDKLRDQEDAHWRVEEMTKQPHYEGKEVYRKAKLRRIE